MKFALIGLAAAHYALAQIPDRGDKALVNAILFVGLCVLIVGIKNK